MKKGASTLTRVGQDKQDKEKQHIQKNVQASNNSTIDVQANTKPPSLPMFPSLSTSTRSSRVGTPKESIGRSYSSEQTGRNFVSVAAKAANSSLPDIFTTTLVDRTCSSSDGTHQISHKKVKKICI